MLLPTLVSLVLVLALGVGQVEDDTTASSRATDDQMTSVSRTCLLRGHSHNDYTRTRPLWDALALGYRSIEADVHLVDGELLVAHDLEETQPGRTLQRMYLDPLREIARTRNGRIYPDGPPLILLVDLKTEAEPTYAVLRRQLLEYRDMIVRVADGELQEGAVMVILSENRPREMLAAEEGECGERLAFYDGRLPDLADPDAPDPDFMPLVSSRWSDLSEWKGEGPMPPADRQRLSDVVERAHSQGRIIRFWGTPHDERLWQELLDAGVDLLNTDELARTAEFLRERDAQNGG